MKAQLLLPEVTDPEHCVRSHLKLSMLQRQWLMDGFVLAKALKRTLVLPPYLKEGLESGSLAPLALCSDRPAFEARRGQALVHARPLLDDRRPLPHRLKGGQTFHRTARKPHPTRRGSLASL